MQDEVHRVAVSFHRKKRSRRQTESELTKIEGIGEKTATELLRNFKSVKRIEETGIDSLAEIVGKSRAEKIFAYFHRNESGNTES